LEWLKHFSVSQRRSNVSAFPKRHAWNGRNVLQVCKNIKTLQPFQALPLERLKRFAVSQRHSNVPAVPSVMLGTAQTLLKFAKKQENVSAIPSITLGTAEAFRRFAKTLKCFGCSKRHAWKG